MPLDINCMCESKEAGMSELLPLQRSIFDPPEPHFDGVTFDANRDRSRLTGQLQKIFELMRDGKWRTLGEIKDSIGTGSEAGVSARLRDLRKDRWGAHTVDHRHLLNGLWQYRLLVREEQ